MSCANPHCNTIFIHVPKTAGTSMEATPLAQGTGGHGHIRAYQDALPTDTFAGAYKVGFVRDPWDRLVSIYFHDGFTLPPTYYSRTVEGFRAFVYELGQRGLDTERMYPEPGDWWCHHHFLPQWFFVCDESGEVLLDFVGRFERLRADWKHVCEVLDQDWTLPHLRKSSRNGDYRSYYDDDAAAIVGEVYGRDCELFGYMYQG